MGINSRGKITKAQLSQSLIDELMSGVGSAGGGSVAIKKYTKTIVSNTDRVFIGNEFFDKQTDQLMVFKNSIYLELNEDYILNDDYTISPLSGVWEATEEEPDVFNFICMMNTPGDVMFSGSRLTTESVTEDKLSLELQDKINNGVVKPPSTAYRAEKTSISISDWSSDVNEDGLYTTSFTHGLSSRDLIVSGIDTDTGRNVVISYRVVDNNTIEVEVSEKVNMNLMVVDSNEMEIVVQPGYTEGMITKVITTDMWVDGEDGIKTYDINHGLNSKGLIISAHDVATGLSLMLSYKIVDNNTVQIRTSEAYDCEVNISYRSFNQFFNIDDNNESEQSAYSSSKVKSITGDIELLKTEDRSSLVNAINETSDKLNKSENSKYTTENGIKEFSCKDGYIDNIYLEGETLVNLSSQFEQPSRVDEDNVVRTRFKDYADRFNPIVTNGDYTLINFTDKILSFVGLNPECNSWSFHYMVQPYTKVLVNVTSNQSICGVDYGVSDGWSSTDFSMYKASNHMLLKGDHTNKPMSYFEGLRSIGQGDSIEVLTRYEKGNLFDNKYKNGSFLSENGAFYAGNNATAIKKPIYTKPNTKYSISHNNNNASAVYEYDINMNFIKRTAFSENSFSFITTSYTRYINFFIGTNNDGFNPLIKTMINEGEITLYQEPIYDEKQIPVTLRSLPNGIKDTIEKRGNKYYKIKRCEEIIFDGGETIIGFNIANTVGKFAITTTNKGILNANMDEVHIISDKLRGLTRNEYASSTYEGVVIGGDGIINMAISTTKLSSQDEAGVKAYLSSNPVTVVYELATPIIEELPNFNPQTFEGDTTLIIDSGVVQTECDFEVTNSMGSELEVLKDKVSSLDGYVVDEEVYYPTLLNGWTGSIEISKVGRNVVVNGGIKNPSTVPSAVFKIPQEVVTTSEVDVYGILSHLNKTVAFYFYNGMCRFSDSTNYTANSKIKINFSYFIK